MAKSRKSRRERRLANEKSQTQNHSTDLPKSDTTALTQAASTEAPKQRFVGNKDVIFAEEYQYVYTEIRNITIITIVMFAVLFGLSNFI